MADPLIPLDTFDTLRWSLERSKCERDFVYLAEHYLRIKSKTKIGLPTLHFNAVQRHLHETCEDQLKRTGYVRKIYGKSRQVGSSTYFQARTFHQTAFHDYRNALFLAHDEPSSIEIFGVTKSYYDALPIALKPRTKYDARQKIEFIGRNSKILSAHAANINVAAGQMYHIVHMTEAARYPNPEKVQASLFPSISEARGDDHSMVVIESTSVFGGDWFKSFADAAARGENEYEFHFIPWFQHDAYTAPVPHDFEPTHEEREWRRKYGLTNGQIAWWRQMAAKYASNPSIMRSEFPFDWESSWVLPIGTLRVFTEKMLLDAARAVRPPDFRAMPTSTGLERMLGGPVEVWEAPQPGVFYHFGCLPSGEKVWTSEGLVPIERVTSDDLLLSNTGEHGKPLNVQQRIFSGSLVGITLAGSPDSVWMTPEHPVLVTRQAPSGKYRVSVADRRQVRPTETEWRRADAVQYGDVVCSPHQFGTPLRDDEIVLHWQQDHVRVDRQVNPRVLLDPEFWFIVGLWLAEGYVSRRRLVDGCTMYLASWTLNHTTDRDMAVRLPQIVSRLLGRKVVVAHPERSASEHLVFCQPFFDFLVANFGTGAAEKRLPGWVLRLPESLKLRLFEGYWRGDGCTAVVRDRWPFLDCVSVSRDLLTGMQALLASLRVVSCLRRLRPEGMTHFPSGQVSRTRETWSLTVTGSSAVDLLARMGQPTQQYRVARRAVCSAWFDETQMYTRVKKVQRRSYQGLVHNFETPSHTYVANRMTVHNCDLAEGRTEQADWSVGCVVRRDTLAQVAQFRVHENPASTDFLDLVYWLGMAYNCAEINPDITGGWGNALLTELQYRNYPNIWRWRRRDDAKQRVSSRIGFLFTKRDKAHLVGNAVALATRGEVAVASEILLDEMRSYLNIGLDEWSAAPGQWDDCLQKGTFVKTVQGWRPIETVCTGDFVLTHRGRYRRVTKTIEKQFSGLFYTLRFYNQLPLRVSYNHPVYASQRRKDTRSWVLPDDWCQRHRGISLIEPLEDAHTTIVKDAEFFSPNRYVTQLRLPSLSLDADWSYFLGRFLADGHRVKNGKKYGWRVELSFHTNDESIDWFVRYWKGIGLTTRRYGIKGTQCTVLQTHSRLLWQILDECYDENSQKVLPARALTSGKHLTQVLWGWLDGDGWDLPDGKGRVGASTSKALALAMRDIALASGFHTTISTRVSKRYGRLMQRQYWVYVKPLRARAARSKNITDFEVASGLFEKRSEVWSGVVYNLEVDEDESFVADGLVVHNCATAWMLALLSARDERTSSGAALAPDEAPVAKDPAKWHNVDADLDEEEATALIRMAPWKG